MNRPQSVLDTPVRAPDPGQMMFSLLDVARALEGRLEEQLAQVGLSMSKLGVLTQLVDAGAPLPLSALAARLSCVRSNMTQLADRLEAEGLVRRVDDPNDRRGVLAMITPLGAERQVAGARVLAGMQDHFAESLPAGERAVLARALAALG